MKRTTYLSVLLVSLGIAGCTDVPTSTSPTELAPSEGEQPQMSRQDAAAPRGELIATPSGWYHRSCVHAIPEGARGNRHGTVTRRDGTSFQTPNCLYPGRRTADGQRASRGSAGGRHVQGPTNNGWIEYALYGLSGDTYGYLLADWEVPDDPSGYSGNKLYYTFPGLQGGGYILQPVLQYGDNGAFGGSYWTLASWSCDDGQDCNYSTPISASAGDDIRGSVEASDCANRVCDWTIITRNVTTQTQTTRVYEDTLIYATAFGGAVEVNDITACSQYPEYGVSYTSIALKDEDGNSVTPTWTDVVASGLSPECNFDVASTSSTVDFDHYGSLSALISGSDEVAPEEDCAWQAWPGGGIAPYSYDWWGALTGSSQTMYGSLSQSSYLWVEITDATSAVDTAQVFIDVDEAYECAWR